MIRLKRKMLIHFTKFVYSPLGCCLIRNQEETRLNPRKDNEDPKTRFCVLSLHREVGGVRQWATMHMVMIVVHSAEGGCTANPPPWPLVLLDRRLCYLCLLTFWGNKIKTPCASHGIPTGNYKSPPCLIWISPNELKAVPCLIT